MAERPERYDMYAKGWEAAMVYAQHLAVRAVDVEDAREMIGVQVVEARKRRYGGRPREAGG